MFISLSFIPVTCFILNMFYRKARETIQRLVAKIQGGPLDNDDGGTTGQIELMVPGGKVGLIIGKSGETIKQIQVCMNEDIVSEERVKCIQCFETWVSWALGAIPRFLKERPPAKPGISEKWL